MKTGDSETTRTASELSSHQFHTVNTSSVSDWPSFIDIAETATQKNALNVNITLSIGIIHQILSYARTVPRLNPTEDRSARRSSRALNALASLSTGTNAKAKRTRRIKEDPQNSDGLDIKPTVRKKKNSCMRWSRKKKKGISVKVIKDKFILPKLTVAEYLVKQTKDEDIKEPGPSLKRENIPETAKSSLPEDVPVGEVRSAAVRKQAIRTILASSNEDDGLGETKRSKNYAKETSPTKSAPLRCSSRLANQTKSVGSTSDIELGDEARPDIEEPVAVLPTSTKTQVPDAPKVSNPQTEQLPSALPITTEAPICIPPEVSDGTKAHNVSKTQQISKPTIKKKQSKMFRSSMSSILAIARANLQLEKKTPVSSIARCKGGDSEKLTATDKGKGSAVVEEETSLLVKLPNLTRSKKRNRAEVEPQINVNTIIRVPDSIVNEQDKNVDVGETVSLSKTTPLGREKSREHPATMETVCNTGKTSEENATGDLVRPVPLTMEPIIAHHLQQSGFQLAKHSYQPLIASPDNTAESNRHNDDVLMSTLEKELEESESRMTFADGLVHPFISENQIMPQLMFPEMKGPFE